MEKEGAVARSNVKSKQNDLIVKLGNIEGKKCRAPHTHQWGNIAYHNAMICSVFQEDDEIKVCFDPAPVLIHIYHIFKINFKYFVKFLG